MKVIMLMEKESKGIRYYLYGIKNSKSIEYDDEGNLIYEGGRI